MNNSFKVLYKKIGHPPETKIINNIFKVRELISNKELDTIYLENSLIIYKKSNKNYTPNIVFELSNVPGDLFLIGYNPISKDFKNLSKEEISFYTDFLLRKSFNYFEYKKWLKKWVLSNYI